MKRFIPSLGLASKREPERKHATPTKAIVKKAINIMTVDVLIN